MTAISSRNTKGINPARRRSRHVAYVHASVRPKWRNRGKRSPMRSFRRCHARAAAAPCSASMTSSARRSSRSPSRPANSSDKEASADGSASRDFRSPRRSDGWPTKALSRFCRSAEPGSAGSTSFLPAGDVHPPGARRRGDAEIAPRGDDRLSLSSTNPERAEGSRWNVPTGSNFSVIDLGSTTSCCPRSVTSASRPSSRRREAASTVCGCSCCVRRFAKPRAISSMWPCPRLEGSRCGRRPARHDAPPRQVALDEIEMRAAENPEIFAPATGASRAERRPDRYAQVLRPVAPFHHCVGLRRRACLGDGCDSR